METRVWGVQGRGDPLIAFFRSCFGVSRCSNILFAVHLTSQELHLIEELGLKVSGVPVRHRTVE